MDTQFIYPEIDFSTLKKEHCAEFFKLLQDAINRISDPEYRSRLFVCIDVARRCSVEVMDLIEESLLVGIEHKEDVRKIKNAGADAWLAVKYGVLNGETYRDDLYSSDDRPTHRIELFKKMGLLKSEDLEGVKSDDDVERMLAKCGNTWRAAWMCHMVDAINAHMNKVE